MKSLSWRRLSQEGGAQIAEFAAVAPLLVMMIFAILWFGRAFNVYTTVNHAARAAAEAASIARCATCASNNNFDPVTIKSTVVDPILTAAHLDPNAAGATLDITSQPQDPNSTVFGPVVTMTYPYKIKLNLFTCCPPGLQPTAVGLTITARAQAQEEN